VGYLAYFVFAFAPFNQPSMRRISCPTMRCCSWWSYWSSSSWQAGWSSSYPGAMRS